MTVTERTPLFELMPAVYRTRDAENDGTLQALLAVIDKQVDRLEGDIATLYEDWFIETCAEWLVPYIGDLLGVRNLHEVRSANFSRRAYVANTLAYRRRKGTLAVIEQLAKDVTGWSTKAVEFFELLSTTQYLNHIRGHNLTTLDLRSREIGQVNTAFESAAHTGEVRRIATGRGRYNILNIGIYLWTLQPYTVQEAEARGLGDFRFFFDPVDLSAVTKPPVLFNAPEAEAEITDLAEEVNVAGTLRRRPLHDELERLRQANTDGVPAEDRARPIWFDDSPVVQIRIDSETDPIPPHELVVCNLTTDSIGSWRRPAATKNYVTTVGGAGTVSSAANIVTGVGTNFDDYFAVGDSIVAGDQTLSIVSVGSQTQVVTSGVFAPPMAPGSSYRRSRPHPIRAGFDPELGRIVLAEGEALDGLRVTSSYGFSGDVGAGPYDRCDAPDQWFEQPITTETGLDWHVGVSQDPNTTAIAPDEIFATLGEAIDAWNSLVTTAALAPIDLITIMDSSTYEESLTGPRRVQVPPDGGLIIAAADWPAPTGAAGQNRVRGRIEAVGVRPHILGDIEIEGGSGAEGHGGRVIFDGLLVEGQVTVLPGDLRMLSVGHCTLVPTSGGLAVDSNDAPGLANEDLTVELLWTITGPISSHENIETLRLTDSIVDAATLAFAISGPAGEPGSKLRIERSTVLGRTQVQEIELGSETLFVGRVRAERTQKGCIRFSSVPRDPDPDLDSRTPRRYRCQPDLALTVEATQRGLPSPKDLPVNIASAIRSSVRPLFVDTDYGRPGFAQLLATTVLEITTGAENESEIGVWSHLMRPQREANLRTALDEYLRFGLEAGPIFVT